MTITAKKVRGNSNVENVSLSDDPTDRELICALGGKGELVSVGIVCQWQVITTDQTDDHLIVGVPPYVVDLSKSRECCTLSDKLSRKLVTNLLELKQSLGVCAAI